MDEFDDYVIVPSIPKSELEQFASFFHQDWKLIFPDFHAGAEMYLSSVTNEQKYKLKEQLIQLVENHKDSDQATIKKEWLNLGAQGWQKSLNITDTLNDFVKMMK